MAGRGCRTVDRGPGKLAADFVVDTTITPDTINGVLNMPRKVARSSATPVKTEANATASAAPVEAGTKPLDRASLGPHFADFGYPPPHRFALLFPRLTASAQAALSEFDSAEQRHS